jgi:hypothetical protein
VGLELVSTGAIRDLDRLLARMHPSLHPGRYVFTTLPRGQAIDPTSIVASIREAEGLSVVVTETDALALGLPMAFTAAWITLEVHSDLAAVGLTAAFFAGAGESRDRLQRDRRHDPRSPLRPLRSGERRDGPCCTGCRGHAAA